MREQIYKDITPRGARQREELTLAIASDDQSCTRIGVYCSSRACRVLGFGRGVPCRQGLTTGTQDWDSPSTASVFWWSKYIQVGTLRV